MLPPEMCIDSLYTRNRQGDAKEKKPAAGCLRRAGWSEASFLPEA